MATNNWWGDRLGPNLADSNPAGEAIQGAVTYDPWANTPFNFSNGPKTVGATVLITNTVALYSSGSEAVIEVSDCTHISGNTRFGAWAANNSLIDAPGIWWGSPDGPDDGTSGSGDRVAGNVIYSPWAQDPACQDIPVDEGIIAGRVTDTTTQALPNILVQVYEQTGGNWGLAGFAWTGSDGRYSLTAPTGTYLIHFVDRAGRYRSQYYDRVADVAQATLISVSAETTTEDIDAVLEKIPAPPVIERGCGRVQVDPNTGQVTFFFPRGCQDAVDIIFTVSCANGATPADVSLEINDTVYPLTNLGDGRYRATVQLPISLPARFRLTIDCDGVLETPIDNPEGGQLYDPSGLITDRETGDLIEGAVVNLFRDPAANPDEGGQTNDCRTVDTRPATDGGIFGNWSSLSPASLDETQWLDPALSLLNGTSEFSPMVNPQITGNDGYYGWDVVKGCWYIQVQASGYETLVSPLVGVPPEVTDLDLKLRPEGDPALPVYLPLVVR